MPITNRLFATFYLLAMILLALTPDISLGFASNLLCVLLGFLLGIPFVRLKRVVTFLLGQKRGIADYRTAVVADPSEGIQPKRDWRLLGQILEKK